MGRTIGALAVTAGLIGTAGCSTSTNEQATDETTQVTATAPDDHCDQDLMVETIEYQAESLDQAVDLADTIIEAKVVDLTTSTEESDVVDGGTATAYKATFQVIKPLKGARAADTKLTSVVAVDIMNDKGEVVTRIGDHRLESLAPGNQVIVFATTNDRGGFVLQPPGPAVIKADKVELSACSLNDAEQMNATTITAIDGGDADSFRSAITQAQQ